MVRRRPRTIPLSEIDPRARGTSGARRPDRLGPTVDRAYSSVGLERTPDKGEVESSTLSRPTNNAKLESLVL